MILNPREYHYVVIDDRDPSLNLIHNKAETAYYNGEKFLSVLLVSVSVKARMGIGEWNQENDGNARNQSGNARNQSANAGNSGGNVGNQDGNDGNQGENVGNQGGNARNQGGNAGNQVGNDGNQGGDAGNQGGLAENKLKFKK